MANIINFCILLLTANSGSTGATGAIGPTGLPGQPGGGGSGSIGATGAPGKPQFLISLVISDITYYQLMDPAEYFVNIKCVG